MSGILATTIITVILVSLFEFLLPSSNIKKVAMSIIGVIFAAIIISPVVAFISSLKTAEAKPVYNFYEGEIEIEKKY